MHRVAESGTAAHWRYKTGINEKAANRLQQSFDDWILEVEKLNRIKNKQKILNYLKEDLFADKIFVFTPKREIIKLPKGSTSIDFAFRIHSTLGLHLGGSKVNGRLVPIYSELANGDEIEIVTKNTAAPSIDWLGHSKTSAAKQKIRQFLRVKNRDRYINVGRQILDQFRIKHNLVLPQTKQLDAAISDSRLPYQNLDEALIGLAEKALPVSSLSKVIFPNLSLTEKKETAKKSTADISKKLAGIKNIYAGCCKPKKNDKLTAYVGQDHLIKIHKSTCGMIKNVNPERLIEL
jgi:GTP pyrophosphokinase